MPGSEILRNEMVQQATMNLPTLLMLLHLKADYETEKL